MSRHVRLQVPGGYYHVTTRGNNRAPILLDAADGESFERCLARAQRRAGWDVLAYCLMPNHFHLVVRLREGGLSGGMALLNGRFARRFNLRHERRDHVFGRRFWSVRIESEAHLRRSCRYTVLNPVRASIVESPEQWSFSSYRASAGLAFAPSFLAVDALHRLFGPTPISGRDAWTRFVAAVAAVPGTVDSGQR